MNETINIITNSIKYNNKKIIFKKNNANLRISLFLLKMNFIKSIRINKEKLILSLNFLKNKPILKNIAKNKNKGHYCHNNKNINFKI